MTCDEACMARVGVPTTGNYTVVDVVTHQVVMTIGGGQPLTTKAPVPGNGASTYYRLTPA